MQNSTRVKCCIKWCGRTTQTCTFARDLHRYHISWACDHEVPLHLRRHRYRSGRTKSLVQILWGHRMAVQARNTRAWGGSGTETRSWSRGRAFTASLLSRIVTAMASHASPGFSSTLNVFGGLLRSVLRQWASRSHAVTTCSTPEGYTRGCMLLEPPPVISIDT